MASHRPSRRTSSLAALCAAALALAGCSENWPMFRHNPFRMAFQANPSALSNPANLATLHVAPGWPFQPAGAIAFRASPVIWKGRVYIGNGNGRFYAVDAVTGALVWQYPPAASPALTSQYTSNLSSFGIASSATIAQINGVDAVIFGAPDQSIGAHLGSGRLFALNAATGTEIWKSPEIARLTGLTYGSTSQFHEQIGYSSPLVWIDKVYIGIANHGDNPIQNGRVVAVDLATGSLVGGFTFNATSTRGGGVWSSVATGANGLFVTTGNARCWNPGVCQPAPAVDRSLSMLRLDLATGGVDWGFKPVPFAMDDDPDWSAGAAVMSTSCGTLVASTMKDGWTYAVDAGSGPGPAAVKWQFPPTGFPFVAGDGTVHGDSRFMRSGAAWGDVFITNGGGWNLTTNLFSNYNRLHALNACAADHKDRVRWIFEAPGVSGPYSLGPPTVTCGIVFVGTASGRLFAVADPSVAPASGSRCSHPQFTPANCAAAGYKLVPIPAVLKDIPLSGAILTEPAIANGRVYVSTDSGRVYMLQP